MAAEMREAAVVEAHSDIEEKVARMDAEEHDETEQESDPGSDEAPEEDDDDGPAGTQTHTQLQEVFELTVSARIRPSFFP